MKRYSQNIVLDLEFAPVDRSARTRRFHNEIIQIGAVRVSPEGDILDSFSSFVKPEHMRRIPHGIQKLTGIGTRDVIKEEALETVLEKFRGWVGANETRYIAWSETDLRQLHIETGRKRIPFPEGNGRWLDLQKIYPHVMEVGNGRKMALRVAADWYGIKISESDLHGALYDARLTAELLSNLITGDYLIQKESLNTAISSAQKSEPATFSIGEKFSALMQLKMELEAAAA